MGEAVKLPPRKDRLAGLRRLWQRTATWRELLTVACMGGALIGISIVGPSWLYALPLRACLLTIGLVLVGISVLFAIEEVR